ncbi:hypothetical protein [Powai lake megavirus]|uniref:TIGR03118 family protein n=1 Tax=Powai lake megavirus TaxID=1842663 RepID=A0A167RM99_9VIRU|nr:hypothetical protein QJ849_gp702 [Powai lake megavirus]ANB50864.1 hypothetical protein [Powai lake megavirus]
MASFREIDFHREAVLSSKLPYPYYYPYISAVPNLTGISHPNDGINYNYEASACYNQETGECANPCHDQSNNLFHSDYLDLQKYHYYNYDINTQDPCSVLNLKNTILTSQILDPIIESNKIVTELDKNPKPTNLLEHYIDSNLIDSWGIKIINDTIYVCTNGGIQLYNLLGKSHAKTIGVFGPIGNAATVTGIAHNDNSQYFLIYSGAQSAASTFVVVTRDGTINAYNPMISENNTILVIDNSLENCVYTGVAIYQSLIYVADFYNQRIEVYDRFFEPVLLPFIDESLDQIPLDFAPYNIAAIGDLIYVTYARQNPIDNQYELSDYGYGYINIFTPDGCFVKRFASKCTLNSPWGIIEAPSRYGFPAGSVLVSNYGNGLINVFASCGKYLGNLKTGSGIEIYINGIRGITFASNVPKSIYWTSTNINSTQQCISHIGVINITNK